MISEAKLDESFPSGQFLLDGYSVPFRSDRDGNGYLVAHTILKKH